MERTKAAWRVVSDPYAPESSWVPACAEAETTALMAQSGKPLEKRRFALFEVVALSGVVAVLGGICAGQSVHALYYVQHLFGQYVFNDYRFEAWGQFYYWFNQPNAVAVYIPFFFSTSMGFLARARNLGKLSTVLNFTILTLYFSIVASMSNVIATGDYMGYDTLMSASGVVGAALAHFFGRSIAGNLASVTNPQRVFNAMLWGFAPAVLFFKGLPFLDNFAVALFLCLSMPVIVGLMAVASTGATSLRTAMLLALSGASPLVFSSLLHLPIALWFAVNWTFEAGSPLIAGLARDACYLLALPMAALTLPVVGALIANKFFQKNEEEQLILGPATAAKICPLPVAHTVEQP
jgi:hypothetical protein